jgi:hypothetical protein
VFHLYGGGAPLKDALIPPAGQCIQVSRWACRDPFGGIE